MKNKIAIVTDTNSGITQEEAKELGINLISMPFSVNGDVFYEGVTLSQDEFYKYLNDDADISTSQPAPGAILEIWDNLMKEYDYIIHIPMSSSLSGSMETAKLLAEDYSGKVLVVDNKRISATLKQSVIDSLELIKSGASALEIQQTLDKEALNASIYITVDTLKYLKKGGRITPAAAALGNVFNIKPVLQIQGGKLDAYKKVRGMKSASRVMFEAIKRDLEERFKDEDVILQTAYSGDPELGEAWRKKVAEEFPNYEISNEILPLSVSCHTGPGAIGIGCSKRVKNITKD